MYKKIVLFFVLLFSISWTYANSDIVIEKDSKLWYDSRIVSLYWQNFWTGGQIILSWWLIFKTIEWSKDKITWKLPVNLSDLNVYVDINWDKSNTYKLNIKLPYINYIYAKKWFYNWSTINIIWNNLDYYKTTKIKLDDKIITWNYNNFILNNLSIGKHSIKLLSWGFETNKIEFEALYNFLHLKNVKEINNNWSKYLRFSFDKLPRNTAWIELYNNWTLVNISRFEKNDIIVDNYNLNFWNNFFKLKLNNIYSNIFNIKNNKEYPYISSISKWYQFWSNKSWDKKILDVSIINYNKDLDKIYYEGSIVEVLRCQWFLCSVLIPYNSYYWYFSLSRNGVFIDKKYLYDSKYKNSPLIDKIDWKWEIKALQNLWINWENLDNTTVTSSNLLSSDKIIYWYKTIKAKIAKDYNKNRQSSLTITNIAWSKTITFTWSEAIKGIINWPAIIKELIADNNTLFYPGSKINIVWKAFHKWDIVNIWNYKLKLNIINDSFILPKDINPWEYKLSITNISWIKSDNYNIIVLEKGYDYISMESINTDNNIFNTDTKYDTGAIYSLDINNKTEDLTVKNISFFINNYNKNLYLWTFILKLDWKNIWNSLIDEKWNINFNKDFTFLKDNKLHKLELYKDSYYLKPINNSIILNTNNLELISYKTYKKFNNIKFNNIKNNLLVVKNKDSIFCYEDTETNNCNKFNVNTEPTPIVTSENNFVNTNSKLEIKKPKVNTKVENTINNKKPIVNNNIISVKINNQAIVYKKLILSKLTLSKDRFYKKYINIIDNIVEILKKNDYKMVNLYNKIQKLPSLEGWLWKIINYLDWKVTYEIMVNDNIIKE